MACRSFWHNFCQKANCTTKSAFSAFFRLFHRIRLLDFSALLHPLHQGQTWVIKPNLWNQALTSTQRCLLLIFLLFQQDFNFFYTEKDISAICCWSLSNTKFYRYKQNHTGGVDYFGLELEFNTDWASGAEVDWFDLILVSRKSGSDVDVMSS